MIYQCPRCRKKNRLPETLERDGAYRCGQCGQSLADTVVGKRTGRMAWAGRWKKPPRALAIANGAYLLALLILTIANGTGPEQWWLSSFNLYLPQWLWAIPGGLLLLLTLGWARGWAWVPLMALLWVFGPIMGFCGAGLFGSHQAPGTPLRIMTYNVKWSSRDSYAEAREIRACHPDILQLQDSNGVMLGPIGKALAGWHVRISGQYIVASPHPLPELESRNLSFAGSHFYCVRYQIKLGTQPVTFYDVHLLSPRLGLVSVRDRQTDGMGNNAGERLWEAGMLAGYVREESGPTLLTGDLNAPMQSLVCRRLFDAGLRDAFSEAGTGYGYTYGEYTPVGLPYVRIDHILVSRQWRVKRCWVGNSQGSDHCPVIADLTLP